MTYFTIFWEKAFAFLLFACLFVSCQASEPVLEFDYVKGSKKGPSSWGSLKPEWKICGTGKFQSPIDIPIGSAQNSPTLGDLKRSYASSPAILNVAIHHISVVWKGDAGKLNINGTDYKVKQLHWHSPSEHTFGGVKKDLEVHLVHQTPLNQTAVIGMAFEIGKADPFLSKLMPTLEGSREGEKDLGSVNPIDIGFDCQQYYRYIGSVTSPPCTEGVIWSILKEVKTVSAQQIQCLKAPLIKDFKDNARPVQALEGRSVLFYNAYSNSPSPAPIG